MIMGINNFDYNNQRINPYSQKENVSDENDIAIKAKKRQGTEKCEACENRKYKDGSDEMVSFKSAAHIDPENAGSAVRAHEQEHVSNAYKKAAAKDGEVLQASVSIHTAVCPECGRVYVSGGTTTTQIKYNPDMYAKNSKESDKTILPGKNVDLAV